MLASVVIRLKFFVVQRPGRRNTAVVAHFSKILLAQPDKRCAIKLRIAADEVMCSRHEFFSVYVSPGLHIVVPAVHDDGARVPVLLFARHEVSAFEKQNLLARWGEPVGQRSASRPASNDDHIVVTVCAHACTSMLDAMDAFVYSHEVAEPSDRQIKKAGEAGVPSVGRTVGPTFKKQIRRAKEPRIAPPTTY